MQFVFQLLQKFPRKRFNFLRHKTLFRVLHWGCHFARTWWTTVLLERANFWDALSCGICGEFDATFVILDTIKNFAKRLHRRSSLFYLWVVVVCTGLERFLHGLNGDPEQFCTGLNGAYAYCPVSLLKLQFKSFCVHL